MGSVVSNFTIGENKRGWIPASVEKVRTFSIKMPEGAFFAGSDPWNPDKKDKNILEVRICRIKIIQGNMASGIYASM